jgi:hypothetical protein
MTKELSITELARKHRAEILRGALANPVDSSINGHTTKRTATEPSITMGCHSSQSKEFTEKARAAGFTGVHFDNKGRCHIPNFGDQRKRYYKFRGMVDFST